MFKVRISGTGTPYSLLIPELMPSSIYVKSTNIWDRYSDSLLTSELLSSSICVHCNMCILCIRTNFVYVQKHVNFLHTNTCMLCSLLHAYCIYTRILANKKVNLYNFKHFLIEFLKF